MHNHRTRQRVQVELQWVDVVPAAALVLAQA
jgi:hypothetical protein